MQHFYNAQLTNPDQLLDKKEIKNKFLEEFYNCLDEHLDNSELTIEELSAKLAVSHRTLNRKLSSLVGLPANEVIRNYRLKKAAEYLKDGRNVSEAAYSVGFETPSYFSASFKAFYGLTPSEYVLNNKAVK